MLEAVSAPLRAYLKGRADTVRQIVTSLTDPEASELLEVDGGDPVPCAGPATGTQSFHCRHLPGLR